MAAFDEAKSADPGVTAEGKTAEWKEANEGKEASETLTAMFQAEVDYKQACDAVATVLFERFVEVFVSSSSIADMLVFFSS